MKQEYENLDRAFEAMRDDRNRLQDELNEAVRVRDLWQNNHEDIAMDYELALRRINDLEVNDLEASKQLELPYQSRPLTEKFFRAELEAIERVLAQGQAGKYRGQPLSLDGEMHLLKMIGHIYQAGQRFNAIDEETESPHLMLAVIRALSLLRTRRLVPQ